MTDLDRAARSSDVAIGLADMRQRSSALFASTFFGGLRVMSIRLDIRLVPRALLLLLGLAVVAWIAYKGSQDSRVFWIVTLNGLTLAALFFVVSAGFTLIFGLMRVVNMAHGSLYLLAGYIAFTLQGNWYGVSSNLLSGIPATVTSWIVPLIVATIVIGVAGVLMQQVFLRWNQGQDLRQALITIAISVILADQMVAHFGGIAESIQQPAAWPDSVTLFGVRYGFFRLEVVVGAALLIGALLFLVIKRTRFGMIIRAGVDDRSMVSALGVNIQLVFAGAFFIGALLAGLAGVLGGTMIAVQPGNDSAFLLDSLIVVIIGGMGSLGGAAIGSVSLGQTGIYAVAGFTMANLVHAAGGKHLGWDPLAATAVGIVVATAFGLLCGAIAARSYGIYFLMITLAISVIVFYFFAQVTVLSGYGGIRSVTMPAVIGNPITDPIPLYYTALLASVLVYVGIRYLARTPFGLALQGLRDDPARMQALGYNVPLHRALAFGVGAFIASIAGILSVWYTTQISPGGINVAQTINILVIAVIGGLYRLEGAWIGAIVFSTIDNYSRVWMPNVGDWLGPDRLETVIGVRFLVIVLAFAGGLVGIWEGLWGRRRRRRSPEESSGIPTKGAVDDAVDHPAAV